MNDDNHESEQDHEQREEQGKHEERKQRRNEESEVQSSEQEGKRFGHDATDISKGEIGGTTDSQDSEVPPFDQEPVGDTDASEIEAETHRGQSSDAHVPQIEIEDQAKVDGRRLEDTVTVEGEDGVVEIPAFEVEDASQVSSIQLASTVSIEAEDDYTVPVPQVETDDVVDRTGRELDEDVPMIDQEKAIHIPQIHISNFEPIKPYARLLREPPVARTETVADEIEATEEIVEEEETELPSEITDVESGAAASETGETSSSAGLEEEWPEPLELLFGGGGGEISSDEPVVLCVDDKEGEDFVAILETLVQRLYREKVGGQPDPSRFGDAQELVNETRWVEAEHKIFTAKFDGDEWDTLRLRLATFSYVILYI